MAQALPAQALFFSWGWCLVVPSARRLWNLRKSAGIDAQAAGAGGAAGRPRRRHRLEPIGRLEQRRQGRALLGLALRGRATPSRRTNLPHGPLVAATLARESGVEDGEMQESRRSAAAREGERRETGKQRRLFRPQESGKGKRKRIGLQNENKPKNKCFYDVLRLRR